MNNAKPQNVCEYKKWLKEKHGIDITERIKNNYESVTNKIKSGLEKSDIWIQLNKSLQDYNDEYLLKTKYDLLIKADGIKIEEKPFVSFISKTYRKNILENKLWPESPKDGWILPNNWYTKINDIVRSLIIVKYLDGVEFLIDKIKHLCEQCGTECKAHLEAKEEGYYAAHLYLKQEFEIPKIDWDTERINVSVEIQITTQLQENIRKLLHKYYDERRERIAEEEIKWQWNYKNDEFIANYLGHILHYVEGMIMEIREKQKEKAT